jgi:hypothetical protein
MLTPIQIAELAEILDALKELPLTGSQGAIAREVAFRLYELLGIPYVRCRTCEWPAAQATAHVHQYDLIGDCCFDERLRSSE